MKNYKTKNILYNFIDNNKKENNRYNNINFNKLFMKFPFNIKKKIKKYKICKKIKYLRTLNLK